MRSRLVVTLVFTLALVGFVARSHAAERGVERQDPARFSNDAVALHAAGWSRA